MKKIIGILAIGTLAIGTALADPGIDPRLIGTWTTACQNLEDGTSFITDLTLNANGTVVLIDTNYPGGGCVGVGTPKVPESATFQVFATNGENAFRLYFSEDGSTVKEGDLLPLSIVFTFLTDRTATMKIEAGTVKQSGVPVSIIQEYINALPELFFSKK